MISTHLTVVSAVGFAVLMSACGPYGLRKRGQPLESWHGGDYIGAECNRVMCVPYRGHGEYTCADSTVQATAAERVLLAVCVPRKVAVKEHGRAVATDERHRFQQPDLAALHAEFDDRNYSQLEAALIATTVRVRSEDRDRAYLRSLYAHMVTDDAQLQRELSQIAGLEPEARAAFIGLIQVLRQPPMVADGISDAERYVYYDVPRQVVAARRQEFATHVDAYAALDALVSRAAQDIAMGQVEPEDILALEDLRQAYLAGCEGSCFGPALPAMASETLVRLHIALGNDAQAEAEAANYSADGSFRPTLASAIWGAQNDAVAQLAEREDQVAELVARGMNETVARQRVGVSGRLGLGRSVFRAPTVMPDHARVARARAGR